MKAEKKIESEFLNAQELAAHWNISRSTVWRWTRDGEIPRPVRVGGRTVRWSRAAIIEHDRTRDGSGST